LPISFLFDLHLKIPLGIITYGHAHVHAIFLGQPSLLRDLANQSIYSLPLIFCSFYLSY
jgi:hypothetical protein